MSKALATKNVAAVLAAVAVALGFSFAFANPVKADAVSDLQAQVQALLAQISSLQGGSTTTSTTGFTFTRNLQLGSSNAEVKELQKFLNSHGAVIASTGAGSAGNESTYFGAKTKAAVAKWQAANGVSPASGYWGPITRAKANSMGGGTTGGGTTGGGTTPTGAGITVSAAAQPANSLAPQNAARVPFTVFTITNNSGAAVTVNGVNVMRTGPALDAAFTGGGVVLLDEMGNQLGVQRGFNSDHTVVAGDPFVLNAGQTKTITVAGNFGTGPNTYSGQVVSLTVTGISTSVPVAGVLPITGASHTLNGSLTIGTVTAALSSFDPNNAQTKNIGDTAVKFTGVRLTAGSAEDVKLFSVRFRLNGSVSPTDLSKVVAVVDGTTYPTSVSTDGRYYTVSFAGGLLIQKGFSKDVYLQGDITGVNASSRIAEFDIDRLTDIYTVGQTYGYGIQPSVSTSGSISTNSTHGTAILGTNQPWFQGSTVSIQGGTVTAISNATEVAAQNIAISVPNVALGGFATDFLGEPVTVQSVVVDVATSSSACTSNCLLQNVSIVDSNGAVVAGPVNATQGTNKQVLTFTNAITFPTGRHVYTVKGTVGSGEQNGQTYVLSTTPSSSSYWTNVTGQSSGNTVSLSGVGVFNMNTMTVRGASLSMSLSATPAAATIVAGGQSVLFATVQLDASQSGEDVRVNSIPLHVDQNNVAAAAAATGLSSCQLFDSTGTALNYGSNIVNSLTNDATTTIATTNTKSFSLNNSLTIPKGTVITLALKCNVSSSAAAGDGYRFKTYSGDTLTFTGATSGNSSSASISSAQAGRQTIASTGSITVTTDPSSPSYALGAGGTNGVIVGVAKFRSANEAVNITKIGLKVNAATDVGTVHIFNGSTEIGTVVFTGSNTSATSTLASTLVLPKDTDVKLTLKADLADIGASQPGVSGDLVTVNVENFEGTGASSGQPVRGGNSAGLTSVAGVRVFNTFPTVAQDTVTSSAGSVAVGKLLRFKVTANSAGDVGIYRFTFTVSTTSGVTISSLGLYGYTDASYSTAISGQGSGGLIGSTVTATSTSNIPFAVTSGASPVEIPANATYYFELRGSTGGYTTGSSITTTLLGDASSPSPLQAATAATSSTVWSPNSTTTTVGSVADWTSAFGVVGLPSNGFTQTVTQ